MKKDISRLVRNSSPKQPEEVYALLFNKPTDGCLFVINFNDQVIPKIDCCIWVEVKIYPTELARIINRKKYTTTLFTPSDSLNLLQPFADRPSWWAPQKLGSIIMKANLKFDDDNEQTLFFGKDSSHLFLCDQAL